MSADSQDRARTDARQLSVIIKMLRARDPKTRDVAVRALKDIDPELIADLLADPELTTEAAAYFSRHAGHRRDWIDALLLNPSLSQEDSALLTAARASLPEETTPVPDNDEEEDDLSVGQRLARMNVGQKIKAAMKGDKEVRTILIKDTNREVYKAVLNNPGLKEAEIEMMAKNTGTSAEILRAIAGNREWVSNVNIMHALVMNPKTPVNLTIRFLHRLSRKDIEFIAKSRSLPQALRNTAKRMTSAKNKGK